MSFAGNRQYYGRIFERLDRFANEIVTNNLTWDQLTRQGVRDPTELMYVNMKVNYIRNYGPIVEEVDSDVEVIEFEDEDTDDESFFGCQHCDKVFVGKTGLAAHLKKHTSSSSSSLTPSTVIRRRIPVFNRSNRNTANGTDEFLKLGKTVVAKTLPNGNHECRVGRCKEVFTTQASAIKHFQSVHTK